MEHPTYGPASPEELEILWNRSLAENPGNPRWVRWKEEYLRGNRLGLCKTFACTVDGTPVGEGTLLFSPECSAIGGNLLLADGKDTANVNALRIVKAYEGRGHISRLVKRMESHAKALGYKRLTIGVEARETRNLGIYLHWGYDQLVYSDTEDGVLVLYYAKDLA